MKPISAALIFLIIYAAISGITNYKISVEEDRIYCEIYANKIVESALFDAAFKLKKSAHIERGGIVSESEIDHKEIFETFIEQLARGLDMNSDEEKIALARRIPVLAIIEDDGIILYSLKKYEKDGFTYEERILMPKMSFYLEDDDVVYFPKISGEVAAVYKENGAWMEETASIEDLINRPFRTKELDFLKRTDAGKILRKTISEQISDIISSELANFSDIFRDGRGGYDYYLPPETNEIADKIDGPSILVLIQGLKFKSFDDINIVSSLRLDVSDSDFYVGFKIDGIKYYAKESDDLPEGTRLIEAFSSKIQAIKAGYYSYED